MSADAGQGDVAGKSAERAGQRDAGELRVRAVGGVGVVRHGQQPAAEAVRALGAVAARPARHRAAIAQHPPGQLQRRAHALRPRAAPAAGHGRLGRGRHEVATRPGLQVRLSLPAGRRDEGL